MKHKNTLLGHVFLMALLLPLFSSCQQEPATTLPDYGTESDSARYYFLKGWEEILDNGRWTESELAFRKALDFDPDWLLGKSLIGRITRDVEERKRIQAELEANRDNAGPDERMLVEVNLQSLIASNNRAAGITNTKEFNEERRALAEANFGAFARKYPEDDYFKAEYIEFLHANHGSQQALDSLRAMATPRQRKLGFYISYAASMELELGNMAKAIRLSQELDETFPDPSYLSKKVLKAQILMAQDSLLKAAELMEEVVKSDANHLIAIGMLSGIKKQLAEQ